MLERNSGLQKQPDAVEHPLLNRFQRRHSKDPQALKRSMFIGEYTKMDNLMAETTDSWNQSNEHNDYDLTRIAYQAEPFISKWLEVRRQVPFFLEKAQMANLEGDFVAPEGLNRFDLQDYYSRKIGGVKFFGTSLVEGTSLFDIEQMQLVLSEPGEHTLLPEDIKRINGMFHYSLFSKDKQVSSVIRQSMIDLVTQGLAQPEAKMVIPATLRPFHERILAYFDYYKDLITNPDLGFWDERHLIEELAWGKPWLPQGIALFMPARLGITPASAIKFYQTRADLSWASIVWKKRLLTTMEKAAENAFRKNGLPKELEPFQFYNPQMDEQASKLLLDWYSADLDDKEAQDIYTKQEELTARLTGLYLKALQQDIQNSPRKLLEFTLREGYVVKKVSLSSQYKQTLTFVLHFADGQTHLTLEIDKDQKVFGLPAKLIKDQPHFIELILNDILAPVLETVKKIHPEVEPISLAEYRQKKEEARVIEAEKPQVPNVALPLPEREKFKPVRPRVLSPIARILEGPTPANVIPIEPPKFVVFYSRNLVKQMLGRNASERNVDQAVRVIEEFQHARGDYKKFKQDRVEGEDIWELKIPHIRVLLNHIDGGFFKVREVGYRREIFNTRRREN